MASIMNPDVAGGAFDAFLRTAAPSSSTQRRWQPGDPPMPALFISHGAPPLFDDPDWIDQLFRWSTAMSKPTAILIVSAHWEAAPLTISSAAADTPLVYDFAGFHPRYFRMTYPTPDANWLATRVAAMMPATESIHQHPSRGLDHGAWVPLKIMYPNADVPVVQLSMPTHDPDRLLALGRVLRPLREEGVLIIGSGFMTHGLPYLTRESFNHNRIQGWSRDFDSWAAEALAADDRDRLAAFQGAPGMPYAHPTVEHYTPLFVTLGAASEASEPAETIIDGFQFGLAKRSFQVA
jgi:4,5-DOPA dioxygenase extradiol